MFIEIRKAGLQALAKALGPIGMVRFLQQYECGIGDYTKERHNLSPLLSAPSFSGA